MKPSWVEILLLCTIKIVCRGCPIGYTPAFDAISGTTQSCKLITDCGPGAECRWTPYSSSMMCCRFFPSMIQPEGPAAAPPSPINAPARPPWYVAYETKQVQALQQPEGKAGEAGAGGKEPAPAGAAEARTTARPPAGEGEAATRKEGGEAPALPTPQAQEGARVTTTPQTFLPVSPFRSPPLISPLIVGKWNPISPTIVQRTSSVTLIQDFGYNIIVDTGTTSRAPEIVAGLMVRALHPNSVHMVVVTHGHPDHFGNVALFPNAQFVYWQNFYKGEEFLTFGLSDAPSVKLTDNTDLWKTPGHTPESVTVIVKNIPTLGTLAVTGDLFISETDIVAANLWQALAWNTSIQQQNRNMIICMSNWIVPGHGRMFAVTNGMKATAGCPVSGAPAPAEGGAAAGRGGGEGTPAPVKEGAGEGSVKAGGEAPATAPKPERVYKPTAVDKLSIPTAPIDYGNVKLGFQGNVFKQTAYGEQPIYIGVSPPKADSPPASPYNGYSYIYPYGNTNQQQQQQQLPKKVNTKQQA